jgi:hypothetical protein
MKQTLAIALTLFATTLIFAAPEAFGGEGSLAVSPAVVMLRGQAGESTTQTLTLTNGSSQPMAFEMVAKDVIVRDGKRVFVDAGSIPGSIAATATFSQKLVTVIPGDTARVDVTVTIPPSPSTRAIVALFHGTTKIDRGGFKMTASVGTLLTFALSDQVAMETTAPAVAPPTASSNLSVAQHCANRGTEPVVARGVLAILDAAGRLVGKSAVAPHRLLPGEVYDMKTEYAGDLGPGHYRALMTYDLDAAKPMTSMAEFDVK